MAASSDADTRSDPPVRVQGRLLCIEAQPHALQALQAMLSAWPGLELVHAATGQEGVRLAQSIRPDAVLLDMALPDMSGLEVMRRLNTEIMQNGLRVSLLTGPALSMDVIKAMSLGAFEFWAKPLEAGMLAAGLWRALAGLAPDPARTLGGRRNVPLGEER
jgi:hypothetical protein